MRQTHRMLINQLEALNFDQVGHMAGRQVKDNSVVLSTAWFFSCWWSVWTAVCMGYPLLACKTNSRAPWPSTTQQGPELLPLTTPQRINALWCITRPTTGRLAALTYTHTWACACTHTYTHRHTRTHTQSKSIVFSYCQRVDKTAIALHWGTWTLFRCKEPSCQIHQEKVL